MVRLGRYGNDGSFCIDKKLVENDVRTVDLGRKNFLPGRGAKKTK